ncbi:M48 family metalloprotease [Streptomyces exfoliatus]|uniref:M48 family metalloprotease n=1 Tax=Streptomyces exfoliatus TaxID=1905 RepID=UPI0012FEF57F|nr:M48 family metalloprotease [Streptomyces exfoliatus]
MPAPSYPGDDEPPAYPEELAPPAYPGETVSPPLEGGPPAYPGEVPPPAYPGDAVVPPAYPGEAPPPPSAAAPSYPGDVRTVLRDEPQPAYGDDGSPPVHPGEALPAPRVGDDAVRRPVAARPVAPPPQPAAPPAPLAGAAGQDDLALEQGRRMRKSVQRGIDGAALSHLLVTVPIGLISLGVVTFLSTMVNPVLAMIVPVLWLFSGPLVFQRKVEAAIARRLFGMRRPTPEEAQRLDVVWEQVTRRAGVDRETYELWIQERTELNATAAAGHIVAVTRHAMERLPNSRLAAVLAHELGHHVGGHTWAAMLADWYALPARAAGRAVLALLFLLFRTKHWAGIACGGCLSLMIVQALVMFTFVEGMWWVVLPVAAGPLLIAWLHRRAEFRADAYAVGLGFGEALETVLVAEAQMAAVPGAPQQGPAQSAPGMPPFPQQYQGQQYQGQQYPGQPYPGQLYPGQNHLPQPYPPQPYPGHAYVGQPYSAQPYPGQPYPVPPGPESLKAAGSGRLVARAAHTNAEARLKNVRLVMSQQIRRSPS